MLKLLVFLFSIFFLQNSLASLADLEAKGFTCKPKNYNSTSRCIGCEGEEGAISCTGMMKSYPDLVTIVFNRKALKDGPENLATFFHGLTNSGTTVSSDVLNRFNFQSKVAGMNKGFAMVIPHYQSVRSGAGKNTHIHMHHLYGEDQWIKFQNEFKYLAGAKEKSKFHLMGHSAAYRVLAKRAMDKKTSFESVTLMDAAYGFSGELSNWKKRDVKKFNSYYISNSPTAVQNNEIRKSMGTEAVLLKGKKAKLGSERLTFVELTHNEVNHWTLVDHVFTNFNF